MNIRTIENAARDELFALLEEGRRDVTEGRTFSEEDVTREMRAYLASAENIAV